MAMETRTGAVLPTPGERRAASWAGWFMAITFVTSIPALLLYHSILHDHNYILGTGSEGRVEFAAFLEVLLTIANIGVAVVMFPILKRQSERLALGYVASRIVESTVICVGFISPPVDPDAARRSGGVGWRQWRIACDRRSNSRRGP